MSILRNNISQSEYTKKVSFACKEVNDKFKSLVANGVHSYSKIATEKKEFLVKQASEKFGVSEDNIKLIINI